jgi:L-lactate dehydrogenase complex protein LldE
MIKTSSTSARYHAGERVALFLPCYCDALFPQVGIAMVRLFQRLGVPLDYPIEQTCCGQPAFNAGHWGEAASLAQRFAAIFAPYPWIVVPSGSCGAMARCSYAALSSAQQVREVASRVYDLSGFLVDVLGVLDVGAVFDARVTCHDGCHARRELRSTAATRALLRAVRNLQYVELPDPDECCGFGGFFSVKYAELSASMGRAKAECITQTQAAVVTSTDSSCLMHIEGIVRTQAPQCAVRFMHLAEILASDG